jgi:hypothetical protein
LSGRNNLEFLPSSNLKIRLSQLNKENHQPQAFKDPKVRGLVVKEPPLGFLEVFGFEKHVSLHGVTLTGKVIPLLKLLNGHSNFILCHDPRGHKVDVWVCAFKVSTKETPIRICEESILTQIRHHQALGEPLVVFAEVCRDLWLGIVVKLLHQIDVLSLNYYTEVSSLRS